MNVITDSQLNAIAAMIADRVIDAVEAKLSQKWINREQYAAHTSLSLRTVDRMVKEERVKFKRVGRRVLIEAP